MGTHGKQSGQIKTTDTVFDIIDALVEDGCETIPELAEELELARSTVHNHLTTFESRGLLVKDDREYRLSLRFFKYGMSAVQRLDVVSVAESGLERLAEKTGETVWLAVQEGDEYVLVDKFAGSQGIQTKGKVGRRYPLYAGAAGKSILSLFDDEVIRARFVNEIDAITSSTIAKTDTLMEELNKIREEDVAFSDGEVTDGIRGVASPIETDDIKAATLVSGPRNRIHGSFYEEEIPRLLREVTNSIELELIYG